MDFSLEDVISKIRQDILMDRLELGEVGITLEGITPDSMLMAENGLGLDSVDALDVLVAIQQIFGFKIENIDRAFIEQTCRTVMSLAEYVLDRLNQVRKG
jgi:acyl carrier protein